MLRAGDSYRVAAPLELIVFSMVDIGRIRASACRVNHRPISVILQATYLLVSQCGRPVHLLILE